MGSLTLPFLSSLTVLLIFLVSLLAINFFRITKEYHHSQETLQNKFFEFKEQLLERFTQMQQTWQQEKMLTHQVLQDNVKQHFANIQQQIVQELKAQNLETNQKINQLSQTVYSQLQHITSNVEKRLNDGFDKTSTTFTDVVKRLTIIDEAQKKITELSTNVVNLQNILTDKRARGAFGEVQLTALLRNILPEQHFKLQHQLSNQKRVDCLLILPPPTGHVAIDAKFPLETFQKLQAKNLSDNERVKLEQQFRQDIKKHIHDIADKYIIANETADGAMLFLPAEAIFAEIHSDYPDLVALAHQKRVWLVSPSTLMAILTTARAVIKDAATRKQVHIIQQHLVLLSKDFDRFQKRMEDLAKHVRQANEDVEKVHTSAIKISSRFEKIEHLDVAQPDTLPSTNELYTLHE